MIVDVIVDKVVDFLLRWEIAVCCGGGCGCLFVGCVNKVLIELGGKVGDELLLLSHNKLKLLLSCLKHNL